MATESTTTMTFISIFIWALVICTQGKNYLEKKNLIVA